jgi:formamidopyrimidine-DNA glycosylase
MPELPEVEVVRRGLARHVVGRTVDAVEVRHPRAIRRHALGSADFVAALAGARFETANRRGKYLWLPLVTVAGTAGDTVAGAAGDTVGNTADNTSRALLAHLGMSGQLLVVPSSTPDGPHLRVRMCFTDGGTELRFVDQRTFGGLAMSRTTRGGVPIEIEHIALDPLDERFDDAAFRLALRRRRTGIKRALLDQTLISGVGNIYADEALWHARLHFARATETIRGAEISRLLTGLRSVLTAALAEGGTSFDSLYVDVNGSGGYFGRSLQVYGRAGQPCRRCGTPIRKDSFMNRSSHSCPRCQPRPRRARW